MPRWYPPPHPIKGEAIWAFVVAEPEAELDPDGARRRGRRGAGQAVSPRAGGPLRRPAANPVGEDRAPGDPGDRARRGPGRPLDARGPGDDRRDPGGGLMSSNGSSAAASLDQAHLRRRRHLHRRRRSPTPAAGLTIGKAMTTRQQPDRGAVTAIGGAGAQLGLERRQLLEACELFIYGTTQATNAILEGTDRPHRVSRHRGFPETPRPARGRLDAPVRFTPPVSRALRPAPADFRDPRTDRRRGPRRVPLDEEPVARRADPVPARGVQAIAVCLLWSPVNPAHEAGARAADRRRAARRSRTRSRIG